MVASHSRVCCHAAASACSKAFADRTADPAYARWLHSGRPRTENDGIDRGAMVVIVCGRRYCNEVRCMTSPHRQLRWLAIVVA